jgi:hypothetical protein
MRNAGMRQLAVATALVVGVVASSGCKTAYYSTWEKLGWAKRDILVDRVKDAKEDQEAAKKQFQNALQQFQALTGFQGGELESKYKKLDSEYKACESRAAAVHKQVASVDSVAQDLFTEWQKELSQYEDQNLKRASEEKLRDTRSRYGQMLTAMRNAESKMDPVLKKFQEQVLFLKHNLNAQAISSLQTQVTGIQGDVDKLIKDMDASIQEANSFISQMK